MMLKLERKEGSLLHSRTKAYKNVEKPKLFSRPLDIKDKMEPAKLHVLDTMHEQNLTKLWELEANMQKTIPRKEEKNQPMEEG